MKIAMCLKKVKIREQYVGKIQINKTVMVYNNSICNTPTF